MEFQKQATEATEAAGGGYPKHGEVGRKGLSYRNGPTGSQQQRTPHCFYDASPTVYGAVRFVIVIFWTQQPNHIPSRETSLLRHYPARIRVKMQERACLVVMDGLWASSTEGLREPYVFFNDS